MQINDLTLDGGGGGSHAPMWRYMYLPMEGGRVLRCDPIPLLPHIRWVGSCACRQASGEGFGDNGYSVDMRRSGHPPLPHNLSTL